MNLFTPFTEPTVRRLGWVLVHSLWEGAVIAALLAAALYLLRRRSSNVRYTLSCAALALLAALPAVNFVLVPRFHPTTTASAAKGELLLAPLGPLEREAFADVAPPVTTGGDLSFAAETPAHPAPLTLSLVSRVSTFLEPRFPWVVGAWGIGVVALSVWHLGGWLRVQHLRRSHTRPMGAQWDRTLQKIATGLRITRPVRLLESALVQVPAVVGWLRPVVLVPASAVAGLSPQELEAILAHELAHVRRHDYLVNVLQAVVETLLFYHPAVWWISHQVRV